MAKGLRWMFDVESPFYIKPRIDPGLISWLWRFGAACRTGQMRRGIPILRDLSRASLALHTELAALEGIDSCYKRNGLMMLFRSNKGLEEGLWEARLLDQYCISSKALDHAAVREMEPHVRSTVVGGIYFQEDAHLDPVKFVRSLASFTARKGVSILTATEVLGFETCGKRLLAVKITRGEIQADSVILATGAWSPRIARSLRL